MNMMESRNWITSCQNGGSGLFYITIIFAVVYFISFHVIKIGDSQEEEYNKEVAAAKMEYKDTGPATTIDATNVTLLTDAAGLAEGKAIFDKSCVVCHLAQGQGLVGPNLTDELLDPRLQNRSDFQPYHNWCTGKRNDLLERPADTGANPAGCKLYREPAGNQSTKSQGTTG